MSEKSVHVSPLKPYYLDPDALSPRDVARRDLREFMIDRIMAHSGNFRTKSTLPFLVRWLGYAEADDTSEPWGNLKYTAQLHQYLRDHKLERYIPGSCNSQGSCIRGLNSLS